MICDPAPVSVPNGSGLPATAASWAAAAAAEDVDAIVAVGGGLTNTKWVLLLASGERLVLRWADPTRWGWLGREHVRREALACRLLADSGLPVPALIASDVDGTSAGGPAALLSWRPGHSRLDPLPPPAIDALARVAVAVHQHPVPEIERPPLRSGRSDDLQVPAWTSRPKLWQRAIAIVRAGVPTTPSGLLHRDFHLGNVLWEDDTITGIVDWAETCWGPPDLDVAHLCSDVAMMHDPADAARVRTAYLRAGGRLDPDADAARFWAITDIVGFLPDPAHILPAVTPARPDLSAQSIRDGLEGLLACTLA